MDTCYNMFMYIQKEEHIQMITNRKAKKQSQYNKTKENSIKIVLYIIMGHLNFIKQSIFTADHSFRTGHW